MRIQPLISTHLVGMASVLRTVIWRFSIFSWVLPIVIFWYTARLLLVSSLGWLELDYSDWNDLQIDAFVLNLVSPNAEVPKGAVIDFLIAISVLPLATFTSISVLGGSNGLPDWMLGAEIAWKIFRCIRSGPRRTPRVHLLWKIWGCRVSSPKERITRIND